MAEFVKKTMMGYKEVSGDASDPECTHVILTDKEYTQQHRDGKKWKTVRLWETGDDRGR